MHALEQVNKSYNELPLQIIEHLTHIAYLQDCTMLSILEISIDDMTCFSIHFSLEMLLLQVGFSILFFKVFCFDVGFRDDFLCFFDFLFFIGFSDFIIFSCF